MAIISSGGQKAVNRRSPISPCFAGRIIEWFTKAAGRSYAEKTSGSSSHPGKFPSGSSLAESSSSAAASELAFGSGRWLGGSGETLEQASHPGKIIDLFGVPLNGDQESSLRRFEGLDYAVVGFPGDS